MEYVEIPPEGGDPALSISRSPVNVDDAAAVFNWLLARGGDDVRVDGSLIRGDAGLIGGNGDDVLGQLITPPGQIIYTVTTAGLKFLAERMGARLAIPQEINRAKAAGHPGTVNQFEPRNRIGNRPIQINEWGIDTGGQGQPHQWFVPVP